MEACQRERFCNRPSGKESGRFVAFASPIHKPLIEFKPTTSTRFMVLGMRCIQPRWENTNEWGDYTSMTVDPVDDCTFWYVNEYSPTNETGPPPNRNTRIANFKIPTCGSHISPINFVRPRPINPKSR